MLMALNDIIQVAVRWTGAHLFEFAVAADRTVSVDGADLGRAKTHALDGRPLATVAPQVIPSGQSVSSARVSFRDGYGDIWHYDRRQSYASA